MPAAAQAASLPSPVVLVKVSWESLAAQLAVHEGLVCLLVPAVVYHRIGEVLAADGRLEGHPAVLLQATIPPSHADLYEGLVGCEAEEARAERQ